MGRFAADVLDASIMRGTVMIAPKNRTAETSTKILMRILDLLRD
jgi:hypothetical protein